MVESKKLLAPVQIYALGGLGEVGKNIYCIENDTSILIIDCGVLFPDDSMPGIDYIIPDFTHLIENQSKIKALVITHGHEDHIGGIPFLLKQVNIPIIYAPKIACALIRRKLEDNKLPNSTPIKEYNEDDILHLGDYKVEFFRVTHSIPDSFGFYITTPQGTICESGDFKIDLTPVDGDFNISKLVKFGDKGIDLLMADSTNAEREGYTNSEHTVLRGITDVFNEANGRLIISTFASNISRIEQIIETSIKFKRKIIVFGRSMESNIEAAREFGYIHCPNEYLARPEELKTLPPNQITILCTGTQGEPMAVLSRIARAEHRFIHVMPGDTVVFSSSAIPGNTSSINALVNQLTKLGADVIVNSAFTNLHASGHASKQEMRLLQKMARPKYFMPVHGEYRMLKLHARIGVECGLSKDRTFICENGDILYLINHKVSRGGQVHADNIYIDGKSPVGISTTVMKERATLINEGMVGIFVSVDLKKKELLANPVVESKGFISANKKGLQKKASELVAVEINHLFNQDKPVTIAEIRNATKLVVTHFLFRESHRNPMVVSVVSNCLRGL